MTIRPVTGGVRIAIKAVTRSSKNRVAGVVGERLKVCVTAPPEKGRANALVLETLEQFFGAPVRIVAGETASLKEVEIAGVAAEDVRSRVANLEDRSSVR